MEKRFETVQTKVSIVGISETEVSCKEIVKCMLNFMSCAVINISSIF